MECKKCNRDDCICRYGLTPNEMWAYKMFDKYKKESLVWNALLEEDKQWAEETPDKFKNTVRRRVSLSYKKALKKVETYGNPDWGLDTKARRMIKIHGFYSDTRQGIIDNIISFSQGHGRILEALSKLKGVGFKTAIRVEKWAKEYSTKEIVISRINNKSTAKKPKVIIPTAIGPSIRDLKERIRLVESCISEAILISESVSGGYLIIEEFNRYKEKYNKAI